MNKLPYLKELVALYNLLGDYEQLQINAKIDLIEWDREQIRKNLVKY
jgi:hypothetical protein